MNDIVVGEYNSSFDEIFCHICGLFSSTKEAYKSNGDPLDIRFDPSYHQIRMTREPGSPDHDKPMLEKSILVTLTNPRNRLVWSKGVDVFNLVGLWVYLLSGSENVHPIEFYNPVGRRFVDEETDPTRLRATWGSRLFGSGNVTKVIDLLKQYPTTRRAVLPVFDASDLGVNSRNLPCLASVQFALQGGFLNCFVTMRSQAVIGVLPYDVFLLTMLHEYVAMRTGLPLGVYYHWMPVAGVRENEIPIYTDISKKHICLSNATIPMREMEPLGSGQLALFHMCERKIRRTGIIPKEMDLLPSYWRSFLYFTILKKCENGQFQDKALWSLLDSQTAFPYDFVAGNFKRSALLP